MEEFFFIIFGAKGVIWNSGNLSPQHHLFHSMVSNDCKSFVKRVFVSPRHHVFHSMVSNNCKSFVKRVFVSPRHHVFHSMVLNKCKNLVKRVFVSPQHQVFHLMVSNDMAKVSWNEFLRRFLNRLVSPWQLELTDYPPGNLCRARGKRRQLSFICY